MSPLHQALCVFAESAHSKLSALVHGEPEEQLRHPFETLMEAAGKYFNQKLVVKGETNVKGMGRPDFAVLADGLLTGHVEMKAPGTGARPAAFKGHDRAQWDRFRQLPNVLYTDGNEWAVYRTGKIAGHLVVLSNDLVTHGKQAVSAKDAEQLATLLLDFVSWHPVVPQKIDELADLLAPLCHLLRQEVFDTLRFPQSPLNALKRDWQKLLFPGATEERFADGYAQAVTFGLLLARAERWDGNRLVDATEKLRDQHGMLATALRILTDPGATTDIETSLGILQRVIQGMRPELLVGVARDNPRLFHETAISSIEEDPWLYFYEYFLAKYDPEMRKNAGVYYTPVEVVRLQIRLVHELLGTRLKYKDGIANSKVTILDPAMGTGTYLLAAIDQAVHTVGDAQGPGAMAAAATDITSRLFGFEILVGPYAVAELRLNQAIRDYGGSVGSEGMGIHLTDTLESPEAPFQPTMQFAQKLAQQHEKAINIKKNVPIIVCIGNPPYDRHAASGDEADRAETGGWVRWGTDGKPRGAILEDFAKPARDAGHGGDLKNLYNLYVYFWRWAIWKTFQCPTPSGGGPDAAGIVSFISASSFLTGDAFCGMRRVLREECDEIWVIDLGGEGRGTRKEDNVFAIQTPVCITIGYRAGKVNRAKPAKVHYQRIRGTRAEKLDALNQIQKLKGAGGTLCPDGWDDKMVPALVGEFSRWPNLTDLFPWQHSGVEFKRTWPIAPNRETLERRWRALLHNVDTAPRAAYFAESTDRRVSQVMATGIEYDDDLTPIAQLPSDGPLPRVIDYGFRSFDVHRCLYDARLAARPRPQLWQSVGDAQVFLASTLAFPLGRGPAMTATWLIPDRHFLCGRGGKDIIPLYRDPAAQQPNADPNLLASLTKRLKLNVSVADLACYVYATVAHPGYTDQFWDQLERCEIRVPLTANAALFKQAVAVGRKLIWLHTYGERFVPRGKDSGEVPKGDARCLEGVPSAEEDYPSSYAWDQETQTVYIGADDLYGGKAGRFRPVPRAVWDFEVSDLKVVQSWLGYRMRQRKGKSSSELDKIGPRCWTGEFTKEFLNLLWILEATVAGYPAQVELMQKILSGPLMMAADLPAVSPALRKAPKTGEEEVEQFELAYAPKTADLADRGLAGENDQFPLRPS